MLAAEPQTAMGTSPRVPVGMLLRLRLFACSALGTRAALSFLGTLVTTIALFGIFFVQGIIVAYFLGPTMRGEFGTILFFPRDLLLYVGLLGGVELITSLATQTSGSLNQTRQLRWAAMWLALSTGLITACIALLAAAVFLAATSRLYLLPLVAVVCLYLPLDHLQLTVSGVDRGMARFSRYNWNRLFHAAIFPILVTVVFGLKLNEAIPGSDLELMCVVFVLSRLVGVVPTMIPNFVAQKTESRFVGAVATSDSGGATPSIALSVPQLLRRGFSFACSMLATEFFERLDILIMISLATLAESGNYFVAIPAATLATIIPNALGLFAFNAGANRQFRPSKTKAIIALVAVLSVQVATIGLLMFLLPPMITLFFGPRFDQAILFAIWLLPASALKGYLQFADGFLKGRGQAWIGVAARIIAIFVLLITVWLAYSQLGLLAIPMAATVGQLFCTIVLSIAVVRAADNNNHRELNRSISLGVQP